MKYLEVKNLSVKYPYGALAIVKLNFKAFTGEIYTILGGGESGKTTLFKCLAGLIAPIDGSILVDDYDITASKTKERNVCLVYEDGCFFERRSVLYNLTYPLKIRKVDKNTIKEIIDKTIAKISFDKSLLDVKVKKLSAKDRFLLSLARAYMREADIYLFDDPLKAIGDDRKIYFPLLKEIMQIKAEKSVVLYGTSSGEEGKDINGNCSLINYGINLQKGKISEILFAPNSVGAIKIFFDEEPQHGRIEIEDNNIFAVLSKEKFLLNKNNLLSEIFIGKECLIYNKENLRIYDVRSERLIYPIDKTNQKL